MKSLKFYDSSVKSPQYYTQLHPVIADHSLYFQLFEHRNLTVLYPSDFAFLPLRKNLFFLYNEYQQSWIPESIIYSINYTKCFESPTSNCKGLIEYSQQDISLTDLQTMKQINELTKFMDAYTSNYQTHGTSETLKKFYCWNLTKQPEREYETQQKRFHIPFDVSKFTEADRNFLTIFIF